jgi:hypothetical protein
MCVARSTPTPSVDPSIAAQQAEDKSKALAEKKDIKSKQTLEIAQSMRGGTGRRSLIKGSGGGAGFYTRG